MKSSLLVLSIAIVLFFIEISAQEFSIKNFSIEDGLPHSQVLCGFQDKEGFLWFGTYGGGVSRFDGQSFTNFTPLDGLADFVVTAIEQDVEGNLWFGTINGVSKFDGLNFTTYPAGGQFSRINKIYKDKNKLLWFADDRNGLIKLVGSSFEVLNTNNGLVSNRIFDVLIDRNGKLWIATQDGVNLLENGKFKLISIKDGLLDNYTTNIFEDNSGNIWFTHPTGLTKFTNSSFTKFDDRSGLKSEYVDYIYQDHKGVIWVGCIESMFYLKDGRFFPFRQNNQNFNFSVSNIFEDFEKNIWITTDGDGVYRITGTNFTHLTTKEGISNNIVWSITEDDQNNLWFATSDGLNKYQNNSFSIFQDKNGLPSNTVYSVITDSKNNIWAATFQGLSKYSNGTFENFTEKAGLINDEVVYLLNDNKERLWVATLNGLSILSNGKFNNYALNDNDVITGVFHIFEDSKNTIWVCTQYNGVKIFKDDSVTSFNFPAPFDDNKIWCMAQDQRGNYWFGHWGRGLIMYNPVLNEFKNFSSENGLINDNIASILYDNGYLWLGTIRGASKFRVDDYYRNGNVYFRNYDKNDGFVGIECNQNAIYKDSEDNIWFGTNKGATKYDPSAGYDEINKVEPATHFTGLKLFYINQDFEDYSDSVNAITNMPVNLELPYSQNHLTFDFIGLSFSDPSKVKYKYRMIGVDEDWSPPLKNNHATYTNLSPGEYTFEVIASNNDGIWNSKPTQYSFMILKPFWSQWWFAFLLAVGLVGVIFSFVAFRTRTLQHQKMKLEEQVSLRTRELSEEKEKVELINAKLETTNNDLERFIDELERTNNELEKLSIVARETDNSIYIAEADGEIIWQNDCATRSTGYTLSQLKSERGKTLEEVSFKSDIKDILAKSRVEKKSIVYEVVNVAKNGNEYWSSSTLTPILDEHENLSKFVVVETDITYRKKIEEQLRLAHDQLEQRVIERTAELSKTNQKLRMEIERRERLEKELISAKEEAETSDKLKSEFLAQMSHEIRTPISTVLNYSSLIKEELSGKLSSDLEFSFDSISRAGNRIFRTVDMILNMAEIQTGGYRYKPNELDIYDDVLSDLNSLYRDIAKKKHVEFKVNKNINNTKVVADLYSLTQIFTQIIDNAVKYTDEGKIEVNVKRNEEDHVIVDVLDTGIGISNEYLTRLFEPFSQEEQGYTRKYDGNGLGLALVREFCQLNKIDIKVNSHKGMGTKVSLIFSS